MRISKCEERLVEYRKSYDEVLRASNKDIAQEKDNMSVLPLPHQLSNRL